MLHTSYYEPTKYVRKLARFCKKMSDLPNYIKTQKTYMEHTKQETNHLKCILVSKYEDALFKDIYL